MFATGWEFTALNPFRARLVREGNMAGDGSALASRIEMELRHAPQ